MRLRFVSVISCLFVTGLLVLSVGAARVRCTSSPCNFSVDGVGVVEKTTDASWGVFAQVSAAEAQARAEVDAHCNFAACQACGFGNYTAWDIASPYYSGSTSDPTMDIGTQVENGKTYYIAYKHATCSCSKGGEEGVPYGMRNGEPVPLTFGQKVMRFFGLYPKPSGGPKRPGGS